MTGRAADLHLLVDIAVLRRHVVQTQLHRDGAAASGVFAAGVGHEKPTVLADRTFHNVGRLVEFLVGKPLVDLRHDLLPKNRRRVRARIGQNDLLGVVVATPDDTGIIRGVARKPAVKVARRRAGLSGNGHIFNLRRRAGAGFDGVFQHIGDIPGGHVLHCHMRLLGIVQHDLAVGVDHLRIRSCLAPDALVCKRGIRLRHRLDAHALCQTAHCQRRQINIREGVSRRVHVGGNERAEPHLFLRKLEAVFGRHLRDQLDRNRIDRVLDRFVDVHKPPVDRVGVLRPVPCVGKRIRRIVHHRRRRHKPQLQRRRIDRDRLDGRAGRQIALRGAV